MTIDIYDPKRRLSRQISLIEESPILPVNKKLLLEFKNDCSSGWGGKKVGLPRIVKYMSSVRNLMEMTPDLDWQMIDKSHVKELLSKIDEDPSKGMWAEHDYRLVLRKFVTWMRKEHGYPKGYPDRKQKMNNLPLLTYPEEVNGITLQKPDKLPAPEEVPTDEEMLWLCEAAVHPRDRAFIEGARELGPRVGGWGSRQIRHVVFDSLGARVTMTDKTMNNEPVRLVTSAAYLRQWVALHPFRNDSEAPLWIDLHKVKNRVAAPLQYGAITAIIRRLIEIHNATAESKGRPKINKRFHTHLFRYYAQTRDEKEGVPRSVMCRQRGWTGESRQPDRYARISSKRVDDYYAERYGLQLEEQLKQPRPEQCKRCHEINPPRSQYCYKCGLPLSKDATEMEEQVRELVDRLLEERMRL